MLKNDITGSNPKLPEITQFLTSAPVLFVVNERKYAGHYHTNGYFYVAEHQRYKSKLFNAEGPKAIASLGLTGFATPKSPKCTSWEYIEEPGDCGIEEILARVVNLLFTMFLFMTHFS